MLLRCDMGTFAPCSLSLTLSLSLGWSGGLGDAWGHFGDILGTFWGHCSKGLVRARTYGACVSLLISIFRTRSYVFYFDPVHVLVFFCVFFLVLV